MGWIDEDRLNRGRPQERPSFQDAMEAARRIIPEDPDEPPSFTYAARNVLSGILYGLQQSCPRRVSIVELVQTVGTYLTLMTEDAPQREHDLREVFNAMRWVVRTGSPWRYMPNDLPPWEAVYQQSQRWLAAGVFEAGVFEATAQDLRRILR